MCAFFVRFADVIVQCRFEDRSATVIALFERKPKHFFRHGQCDDCVPEAVVAQQTRYVSPFAATFRYGLVA